MTRMVRKQLYIDARQERMLKDGAEALGTTEAELVRMAIDRLFESEVTLADPAAGWERLMRFVSGHASGEAPEASERTWTREDAHAR